MLAELIDHIDRSDYHYANKWRPGNLLLWDNRCTQHARNDFSDGERRLLRRVVVESTDVPSTATFKQCYYGAFPLLVITGPKCASRPWPVMTS